MKPVPANSFPVFNKNFKFILLQNRLSFEVEHQRLKSRKTQLLSLFTLFHLFIYYQVRTRNAHAQSVLLLKRANMSASSADMLRPSVQYLCADRKLSLRMIKSPWEKRTVLKVPSVGTYSQLCGELHDHGTIIKLLGPIAVLLFRGVEASRLM